MARAKHLLLDSETVEKVVGAELAVVRVGTLEHGPGSNPDDYVGDLQFVSGSSRRNQK